VVFHENETMLIDSPYIYQNNVFFHETKKCVNLIFMNTHGVWRVGLKVEGSMFKILVGKV
jgi:hypothetical protein